MNKLESAIKELIEQCQLRFPIGSHWRHNTLGIVTIARLCVAHDGHPETVSVSPEIVDLLGKKWSCYAPGHDLSPITSEDYSVLHPEIRAHGAWDRRSRGD